MIRSRNTINTSFFLCLLGAAAVKLAGSAAKEEMSRELSVSFIESVCRFLTLATFPFILAMRSIKSLSIPSISLPSLSLPVVAGGSQCFLPCAILLFIIALLVHETATKKPQRLMLYRVFPLAVSSGMLMSLIYHMLFISFSRNVMINVVVTVLSIMLCFFVVLRDPEQREDEEDYLFGAALRSIAAGLAILLGAGVLSYFKSFPMAGGVNGALLLLGTGLVINLAFVIHRVSEKHLSGKVNRRTLAFVVPVVVGMVFAIAMIYFSVAFVPQNLKAEPIVNGIRAFFASKFSSAKPAAAPTSTQTTADVPAQTVSNPQSQSEVNLSPQKEIETAPFEPTPTPVAEPTPTPAAEQTPTPAAEPTPVSTSTSEPVQGKGFFKTLKSYLPWNQTHSFDDVAGD